MSQLHIKTDCYNTASPQVRREIAEFLHAIWPEGAPADLPPTHVPQLSAQSFRGYQTGRLVGYAAVVQKTVYWGDEAFHAAGLSCVATAPDCRRTGVGKQLVEAATEWMAGLDKLDLGVFTCHPDLTAFYAAAGGWQVQPQVTVIGSQEAGALSSQALGVAVLLRLFSPRAHARAPLLQSCPINLALPVGEFW